MTPFKLSSTVTLSRNFYLPATSPAAEVACVTFVRIIAMAETVIATAAFLVQDKVKFAIELLNFGAVAILTDAVCYNKRCCGGVLGSWAAGVFVGLGF